MSPHQAISSISPINQTDHQDLFVLSYITVCYISVVAAVAVVLNGLVIRIYMRGPSRKKKLLLINLAAAEFLMPLTSYWMIITSSPYGYWLYGNAGCQYYAFTTGLFGMVAIGTLTAMAVERYVVCHNFVHLHWSSKVKCQVVVATWLFGFLMTLPPLIGWGRYDVDLYKPSCTWDYYSRDWNAKSFTIFLLVGGFVVPAVIILFCYGKMFSKISANERDMCRMCLRPMLSGNGNETVPNGQAKRHSMSLNELNNIDTLKPSQHRRHSVSLNDFWSKKRVSTPTSNSCWNQITRVAVSRNEKQLAKLIMLVISSFFACWTPYALLTIFCQLRVDAAFSPSAAAITLLFAKSSCAINPIIYALKEKRFRKELQQLFSG